MLDEWREKFVLAQQEAIDIYSEMHRSLHVQKHAMAIDLQTLIIICMNHWCFGWEG